jgi:hypothetical protein
MKMYLQTSTVTIILPAVLFECETWSFSLRGEHTMRLFEDRVEKRASGPQRQEVKEGWHKELLNWYSSESIILSKEREYEWWDMWHTWGDEKCIQNFSLETSMEKTTCDT